MRKNIVSLGLATAFVLLIFWPAFAQIPVTMEIKSPRKTNSLSGRVLDAAGEPLDRVKVERITGPSNEVADSVTADDKGRFELKTVPDGKYILRFSRPGFKTLILSNVVVEKKYAENLTIHLEMGI